MSDITKYYNIVLFIITNDISIFFPDSQLHYVQIIYCLINLFDLLFDFI
jgi:hypothetical protein